MTIDTQASLFTYLYNLLTADSSLQSTMGGTVRLYPVWAIPDAVFPYLVHRADIRKVDDFFPIRQGTLIIDAWSYSPNASEVLSIRKRVIELIDELDFSMDELDHCRVSLETDGFVAETTQDIWHYTMQFSLRFYRVAEASSIISR